MLGKMQSALTFLCVGLLAAASSATELGPVPGYRATYAIKMAGAHVGRATFRFERADTLLASHLDVVFRLKQAGQNVEVRLNGTLLFSPSTLLPQRYNLVSRVNGVDQGKIDVAVRQDSAVALVEASGLGKRRVSVALKEGTMILDNNFCLDHYQLLLWRFLRSKEKRLTVPFLVPQILVRVPGLLEVQLQKQGEETFSIGDSSFACWKIQGTSAGGLQMNFLVRKRDGVLLRWEVPAQASVATFVQDSARTDTGFGALNEEQYLASLVDRLYIKSYVDLGNWRKLAYLRAKAKLQIVALGEPTRDTAGQTFEGECLVRAGTARYDGVFTVRMVRTSGPGVWLGQKKNRFQRELASEPDIQVNDPVIRAQAQKIAGHARSPWEVVKRVCNWVATEIRYKLTGADALTCLKTREGDCGPKAKLAIAFLRSLGIPARLAGGLLYAGGRWGQHNWVQVYLGDESGWVPVDPTTDETDTFSAAHLTLWEGWAGTLVSSGTDSIEVLEFRKLP